MCTKPVTITRNYPLIGTRTYVVPCGKCAECTRKKQSEFAALAVHQGLHSGSVHFFTFTYRNEQCPIAISQDTPEGKPRIIGFERDCAVWIKDGKFMNKVVSVPDTDLHYTPSLRREDVKLVLKRFRTYWKKSFPNIPLEFKYAVFGELGEKHGRPHYHGLFFGLSNAQAKFLRDEWQSAFGFCHCPSIEGKSGTTLEDITKLSLYTSKYISKSEFTRWAHLMPYVEKPRRQSSIDFGDFTQEEVDKLYDFITCATSRKHCLQLRFWILRCLDAQVLRLLETHSLSLKD